ncbi:hypothetical protein GCM10010975_33330 [Comamonas phosphati]|nr:hypothetical protein GCM10010975_33330 [Comamonas phosphati]
MRRSRFSVEQIVTVPKQAELGMAVANARAARRASASRSFSAGKSSIAARSLTRRRHSSNLQEENARPKRLVADLSLD